VRWDASLLLSAVVLSGLLVAQVIYGPNAVVEAVWSASSGEGEPRDAASAGGIEDPAAQQRGATVLGGPGGWLPRLADLTATLDRPLFVPGRRPPAAAAVGEAPPVLQATTSASFSMELSAVVVSDGERSAYFVDAKSGKLTRLREGDALDGWTVRKVAPDSVLMVRGDERTEVVLRTFKPAPGARRAKRSARKRPQRKTSSRGPRRPRATTGVNDPGEAESDEGAAKTTRRRPPARSTRRSQVPLDEDVEPPSGG
jgi:general secretion pathway protein N